jgi:O-antigen/teichoic acid export membrane protein
VAGGSGSAEVNGPPESRAARDPRHETEAQRADRNLAELLQELRVAGLGVQVLFGFLLSLPFTTRFARLSSLQRDDYLATLLLAALSTVLLVGPVAYHRLVFHRHEKEKLLATANVMALAGLVTVGLAISAAVLLVTSFVEHGVVGPVIAGGTAVVFASTWFVLPTLRRARDPRP